MGGAPDRVILLPGNFFPGFIAATLSYDNIDYKKNANKAFLEFSLNASPGKAVPEDNEDNAGDCERDDCDCQKGSQNENTTRRRRGRGPCFSENPLGRMGQFFRR